MIKLSKIELGFMEGKSEWCNRTFTSWEAFQDYMRGIAWEIKMELRGREWLGYYKSDVRVVWEDGESYSLRYDMDKDGLGDGMELGELIEVDCGCYVGVNKPVHMTEQEYQKLVDSISDSAKQFFNKILKHYDLGANICV